MGFITKVIDRTFQAGQDFWNDINVPSNGRRIESPAHPDLTKFMQSVNSEDLSRPNLFLVRFDNFLAKVDETGDVHLSFDEPNKEESSFFDNYTINKFKDIGLNAALQTSIGKTVIGAYNPKLINMIPGGSHVTGLFSSSFDVNKDLATLVKSVSMPGTSFETSRLYHDKRPMTAVTGRTNDTITMTFYLRTNHIEKQVMDKWMDMVHNQDDNSFGLYSSYARKIDIFPLDRTGVPRSVMQCDGCFPIKISNVQYDVDNNNAVATFDVEFALSTYKTASFEGQSPIFDQVASGAENIFTSPLLR